MKLVLQCAMCGTQHPVGTVVCSTCRATGVTQLRLIFECQSCGRLDLSPICDTCPRPASAHTTASALPYELVEDDLIVAEEIVDDEFVRELDAIDAIGELRLDLDREDEEDEEPDEEDEIYVVDLSEDEEDDDSDIEDFDPDSDLGDAGDEDFEVEPEYEGDEEEDEQDFDDEDTEDEDDS